MDKNKAPIFIGKTIDYPEFKRGRKKVTGVVWDDGNQVEQIKLIVNAQKGVSLSDLIPSRKCGML